MNNYICKYNRKEVKLIQNGPWSSRNQIDLKVVILPILLNTILSEIPEN